MAETETSNLPDGARGFFGAGEVNGRIGLMKRMKLVFARNSTDTHYWSKNTRGSGSRSGSSRMPSSRKSFVKRIELGAEPVEVDRRRLLQRLKENLLRPRPLRVAFIN
jgi:hypothetical protein